MRKITLKVKNKHYFRPGIRDSASDRKCRSLFYGYRTGEKSSDHRKSRYYTDRTKMGCGTGKEKQDITPNKKIDQGP